MSRKPKRISDFDRKLGNVVRSRRTDRDYGMTQAELARLTDIPLSNLQRREDGTNEITVSELERIAHHLRTTPAALVEEALTRYGGLAKLIEEYSPTVPVSDAPDNVVGIRSKSIPGDGAQEDFDERQPYAANFDTEHEEDEPDPA